MKTPAEQAGQDPVSETMQDAPLMTCVEDGVLWLTLNRPQRRNALNPALYDALATALEAAWDDRRLGAIVLTGAGGTFCAGGDVGRMAQTAQAASGAEAAPLTVAAREQALRRRSRLAERLHHHPLPTIALIQGAAVGAGMSLALACDLRYADPSARMKTGFADVGLPGDFGGHYFLPRLVGAARARELYLLSPMLDADRLAALGLVHAVLPAEDVRLAVTRVAQQLAHGPQPAMRLLKENLNDSLMLDLPDMLDREAVRHVRCVDSPDHREAVQAFVQKRRPVFGARAADDQSSLDS